MSSLKYYSYEGTGEENRKKFSFSQAVRVPPNRIELAGQTGRNPETGKVPIDIDAEIDQAFSNVELAIKDAGGKGWSQVFRVTSYHVAPFEGEVLKAMVRNLRKWMPDHQPIWTCVGVAQLALKDMKVEIEAVAIDEESP